MFPVYGFRLQLIISSHKFRIWTDVKLEAKYVLILLLFSAMLWPRSLLSWLFATFLQTIYYCIFFYKLIANKHEH
jgi:hypothetical protein